MKFSDGNWMVREGFQVINPVEVYDFKINPQSLEVFAPPKHIAGRGGQLDTPLMHIRYSSPIPNVICVRMTHHKGKQDLGPHFSINQSQNNPLEITETEAALSLKSGQLSVDIRREEPWTVEYLWDNKHLTSSSSRGMGYIRSVDNTYVREQLDLSVGEFVYGLGERFTSFTKNGQSMDMWNRDGGTSTEQSYKNIPFYITNKGYGVFVNHPEEVSFEVGSEKVSKVQFSVSGEYLEYYIIGGANLKEVLGNYTSLTGKPALPPAWTFGLWLTTSFTTNYDEATVTGFVEGMAERNLPLRVFHFDCFWMKEFHWCDFEWDSRIFPEPEQMLTRLKSKGLKICVWINPYIAQRSHLFDEGMEKGYLVKRANGDVWQWDMWQPGMGLVDFTNPAACEWYASKLSKLIDMGVDSFKTDFGERIPTDVVYYDGSDPVKMHNYYTFLYNKVVFDVLKAKLGHNEAAVFARSATVGGQQFPVHWGGDCSANYESMAESLRGGLSLGLSGFGFWSHDIGGFENTSTADVYKRWIAFGLLSSHSRLHGNQSYRVPWTYDEEAVDVLRFFTNLKCSLMPYLFAASVDASVKGLPVMRGMVLEFAEDPTTHHLDRQYMLGDSLLVAPIFNDQGEAKFYLPQGTWTNFFTGESVQGERWISQSHTYLSVPLFVRPNSIIAVGNNNNLPDYDYADGVELQVYGFENDAKASTVVYSTDGQAEITVTVKRVGKELTVEVEGSSKPWTVVVKGIKEFSSIEGAATAVEATGLRLLPNDGQTKLVLQLS
ncbi:alpha-xylosidase [Paenibacillus psychroresistens]|uniref:alpha-D-xyloside xylohydrolase n=1 Tax=Paenibacillus psychroresistens TaxID=1778678 RepID=A0A6B8RHM4_9BACL|nr:alpha-xylosidase [Paenibacillus psychroresistens]QGQ94858.1 alpha-xylosidase [Paenibacillus psychroresistens]